MEGLPTHVQDAQRALDAEMKAFYPEGDTSTQAAPVVPDTVDVVPAQADTPTPQPQAEDYKAKYDSLQGKYNAELPRLAEHIRVLEDKLRQMEADVASQTPPAAPNPEQTVSREAIAAYDDEFGKLFDLMQEQKNEIATLKASLAQVQGSVSQVHQAQAQTQLEIYEAELSKLVPDHKALNGDPAFNAWLNENDGYSDETRRTHGLKAVAAFDHVKVARMYNEYKSTLKATPPPPAIPPNITPETSSVPVDTSALQQQGSYTTEEMNRIFDLRTRQAFPFQWRGTWVKNDQEAELICAEIIQAAHAGRIV